MASTPITLPSIYKSIQAPKGANAQDVQSTQDQMAMQYQPQESGISNTINQIQGYLDRDVNAQQQYGQIADQKISNIGSQLAETLQGNVGKIGDIYTQGQASVGAAYDEAGTTLGNIGASVQGSLSASAKALGQEHAIQPDAYGTNPLARLQAGLATMQGTNATGKATATSRMATLGTALQGIAQKAVGDSVQDYAQKRTNVATQVLKVIGQLQMSANTSITEQLQKFSDLAATEGPAFRTLLNQATTARSKEERQQALDAFSQAMDIAKLNQAQSKIDKEDNPNSLDNIIKQQTIAKNSSTLEKDRYSDSGQGYNTMMEWLNDLRVNKKALSGTQYSGIQNFINQNAGTAAQLNQDPYNYLVGLAQTQAGRGGMVQTPGSGTKNEKGKSFGEENYQVPLQVLLDALSKRYTGVASSGAKIGTTIK